MVFDVGKNFNAILVNSSKILHEQEPYNSDYYKYILFLIINDYI